MNKNALKIFAGISAIGALIALIGICFMIVNGGYPVLNYVWAVLALAGFGYGANYLYQKTK